MRIKKLGLFVSGPKGFSLLEGLISREPFFVSSYRQNSPSCRFDETKLLCENKNIPFFERKELPSHYLDEMEFAFMAGWQFMMATHLDKIAVFHDSLLPKYRGFSPTVSALINGENKLGVTLIRPADEVDAGPILGQKEFSVIYPVKISEAYKNLGDAYVSLANQVLDNPVEEKAQDHSQATFALWRDKEDYQIRWEWDAKKIKRFVDALGDPYDGARTILDGIEIKILEVESLDDLSFVNHEPGKVWNLKNGIPTVVTGSGLIRILKAESLGGEPVSFSKLRCRFK